MEKFKPNFICKRPDPNKKLTAEDYKYNTKQLLDGIIALTNNGTKVYLFDEPPFEVETETNVNALEVNDRGEPISTRTISGIYKGKFAKKEKDIGYGTYKHHNDDGSVDVLAITKNQWRLKQITMAALVITDPHQFAVKCRMLWGGHFGVILKWDCSEEFRQDFAIILQAIRNQIFMELSSAMFNPELTTKAKFYFDILQKTNPTAFGKQVNEVKLNANVESDNKTDTTLKVVFGEL